jgi:hypothetical protein
MKLLLAFAMAVGLAILPVQQAFACSCAEMTIEEAAASAHAVFTGTVVDQQPVGRETGPMGAMAATVPMPGGGKGQIVYTFAVDGVVKGEVGERASVLGGGDDGMCGMSFGVGERWLLFTMWDGTVHSTSICSGNIPLGADEDPPLPLSAPIEGADVTQPPIEIPWTAVALLGAIAVVVGVSAFAFRRSEPDVV